MTNSKSTKRALFTSALAMLMCVAMLIGTTFAWFTDTASTAVNKIQAGNLDVALEMNTGTTAEPNCVSAEGKTLEFKKAAGAAEDEAVLWEPGCTYELPELRVVNNGNLALKYKVIITGINGNAKLNEAIDWTIGDVALGTEQHLTAGANSVFTIKGHMKEDAGNEYQDLSIDGISITVVATQYTYESDSEDNQYDKDAAYSVTAQQWTADFKDGATVTVDSPTVIDGKADSATGVVNSDSEPVLSNAGDVKLDLENTVTSGNLSGYTWGVMRVMSGTTLEISGNENGKFINTKSSSIINVCGGNVVVNSGYFESTSNIFFYYTDSDDAIAAMSLTINGGTFKAEDDVVYNPAGLPVTGIVINGGTFYGWDPSAYVDSDHTVTTSMEDSTTIYTVTAR